MPMDQWLRTPSSTPLRIPSSLQPAACSYSINKTLPRPRTLVYQIFTENKYDLAEFACLPGMCLGRFSGPVLAQHFPPPLYGLCEHI
jgi:hypothetical protein